MENPSTVLLNTKLGVTEGVSMALLHAPSNFDWSPPPGVRLMRQARGHPDVVLAFFTKRSMLEHQIEALSRLIFLDGSLWVAWPKRLRCRDRPHRPRRSRRRAAARPGRQ